MFWKVRINLLPLHGLHEHLHVLYRPTESVRHSSLVYRLLAQSEVCQLHVTWRE